VHDCQRNTGRIGSELDPATGKAIGWPP
jgi:hypothetical protein